jgi:hypothetical protein
MSRRPLTLSLSGALALGLLLALGPGTRDASAYKKPPVHIGETEWLFHDGTAQLSLKGGGKLKDTCPCTPTQSRGRCLPSKYSTGREAARAGTVRGEAPLPTRSSRVPTM